MSDQPKRLGRPPIPPANRKRFNLTFRVRADLRSRLAAIAEANCRSISEEVEYRLEASFRDTDLRAIVSEEIAAALTSRQLPADFFAPLPERGDLPVQPPDRDWLRLSLS